MMKELAERMDQDKKNISTDRLDWIRGAIIAPLQNGDFELQLRWQLPFINTTKPVSVDAINGYAYTSLSGLCFVLCALVAR